MDHPEPVNKTTLTLAAAMTLLIAIYFGSSNILGTQNATPSPTNLPALAPQTSLETVRPIASDLPLALNFARQATPSQDEPSSDNAAEQPPAILWSSLTATATVVLAGSAVATSAPRTSVPRSVATLSGQPPTQPRPATGTLRPRIGRPIPTRTPVLAIPPANATDARVTGTQPPAPTDTRQLPTPLPAATNTTVPPTLPPPATNTSMPPTHTPRPSSTPQVIVPTVANTPRPPATPTPSLQPTRRPTATRGPGDD